MEPLDRDISTRIRLVRVICIFFMMYVHVNPGLSGLELDATLATFDLVLADFLGRASVPALSLISGLLIVHELHRKPYGAAVKGRVRSLILPMVTWNLLIILFSVLICQVVGQETSVYRELDRNDPVSMVLGQLLGLNNTSVTPALAFLRDIFVCAVLSPLLIVLVKRLGWIALVVVWSMGLTLGFEPVVYRPYILMFYVLGIYCALTGRLLRLPGRVAVGLLLVATVIHLADAYYLSSLLGVEHWLSDLLQVLKRLALAMGIVCAAGAIMRSKPVGNRILAVEPRIYFIFLSHNLIFLMFWGAWQIVFGSKLDFPYLIFFLGAPLAVLWLSRYLFLVVTKLPMPVRIALLGK